MCGYMSLHYVYVIHVLTRGASDGKRNNFDYCSALLGCLFRRILFPRRFMPLLASVVWVF